MFAMRSPRLFHLVDQPMKTTPDLEPWMHAALREGFEHLNADRMPEAAACCQKLLTAKPDHAQAHFLVGLCAVKMKKTKRALKAFRTVASIQPDHAAAWSQMARMYVRVGQTGRAETALDHAVQHCDDNPVVMDTIGNVHGRLGNQLEAAEWFAKALEKRPNSVPYMVNQAATQIFLDRMDEAETLLKRVLELSPGNPNAHWQLSGLRKAKNRDHLDTLKSLVQEGDQSPRSLSFLYYGMGKELEDLEDWDAAFDAFSKGAAARRESLEFDESEEEAMFDALASTYTQEWLGNGNTGIDTPAPIFVVGQPRTGTTLIERIITSHSQVHSAGELKQLGNAIRRISNNQSEGRQSADTVIAAAAIDPEQLGKSYMHTTRAHRGELPRFVDKLPPNYLYIPLILKALPRAKIVHLRRGPMDACFASFKQLFADAYPHSYDQEEMARHHARYYKLMETWRQRFGDRFLDISYEKTAGDLEPNARKLIEFLELPWEDPCLEFHKQSAAVTTASAVQVRQPAHTRSVGRWRRYEQQLTSMQNALTAAGVPLEHE